MSLTEEQRITLLSIIDDARESALESGNAKRLQEIKDIFDVVAENKANGPATFHQVRTHGLLFSSAIMGALSFPYGCNFKINVTFFGAATGSNEVLSRIMDYKIMDWDFRV